MLNFKVESQKLIKLNNSFVVADSRNYLTAGFSFSDDWNDVEPKTAVFTKDGSSYDAFIEDGICTVPWEVLCGEGRLDVSVNGGDLITTNIVTLVVHKSGVGNLFPTVASPSVYSYVVDLSASIENEWTSCKQLLDTYKSDIETENAELDKRIEEIDKRLADVNDALTSFDESAEVLTGKCNEILAMVESFKADYAEMLVELSNAKDTAVSSINSVYNENVNAINALADEINADISAGGESIDAKISEGISSVNSAKETAIAALETEIESFKKCDWIYTITNNQITDVVDIFNNLVVPESINGIDSSEFVWNKSLVGLACGRIDLSNVTAANLYMQNNNYIKEIIYGNITSYGANTTIARGSAVESVVFNNTEPVPEMPGYAFVGCTSLKSIKLGEGITGTWHSFTGCSSLTDIEFPSTMKNIGYYSFVGCTSLTSITIPESVETIDSTAFATTASGNCLNLKTITINKPADSISGAPWGATNATVVWTGTDETTE